uniref:EDS1 EP domain-containing protein n=1 Tax=Aegilops tauschii subsp. strangulata TaxID=200361 RepID=A0A453KS17_AEGTS
PPRGAALSDDDRLLVAHCAALSFPSASRSPPSAAAASSASFQAHHASHPYPCAAFVFPPTWSAAAWMPSSPDAGGRAPFGDAEVDPALFPSLRSVGSGVPARASAAFVAAFSGLLDGSPLQTELDPQQQLLDAAARSLSAHWEYESIKQSVMQEIGCVDYLRAISSSLPGRQMNGTAIGGLELSKEAMLSLAAAAQWEKQREINQAKIDANCSKIQEALKSLNEYKRTCELHEVSYYDSFKLQREVHDFNSNVRRLELAGFWDEIIEMLRRRELPDAFEGREEWVNLGTSYRRLVEPLDIANYYRHSKNEDTGSYLSKGRPRRYKYTQKWREQSHRIPLGSSLESCFWAMSEELQAEMINGKSFEDLKDRVGKLESDALGWFTSGNLGRDVFLSSSSFVIWWKTLPEQHRSASCIARLVPS